MYTDTAKEFAEERHALLQRFADALEDETISAGHAPRGTGRLLLYCIICM